MNNPSVSCIWRRPRKYYSRL